MYTNEQKMKTVELHKFQESWDIPILILLQDGIRNIYRMEPSVQNTKGEINIQKNKNSMLYSTIRSMVAVLLKLCGI